MPRNRSLILTLTILALAMLGCGGVIDTIKGAVGLGEDPGAVKLPAAPAASARTGLEPGQLTSSSVVLMGNAGTRIGIYAEVSMEPDGNMRPRFEKLVKQAEPGARGRLLISHDVADATYAMEIELSDGTEGNVKLDDVGLIRRVTRVRSDDTLNVRSGRSHKRSKVAEIGPNAPVFVHASHATDMAGCEGMSGGDKWWRIRTLSGAEGYVNCHYIGGF